jgi:hypothetical protein
MNPFEMVVLIVAIVTLGGVIRSKNGTRRGKRGTAPVEEQMENQLLRSEIKELKERIAVLERLATDTHSAAALDREIEKLR